MKKGKAMKKSEWLRLVVLWGKRDGGVRLGDKGWGIVTAFIFVG
jgi:hypothetical protein